MRQILRCYEKNWKRISRKAEILRNALPILMCPEAGPCGATFFTKIPFLSPP